MAGVKEAGKPVKSERRKQQNRQAQKTYRERQIRKLRTLEAATESRAVNIHRQISTEEREVDYDDQSRTSSIAEQQHAALVQLMGERSSVDGRLRRSIADGKITIEDVLKAGIDVLSRMHAEESSLTPASQSTSPEPAVVPRTDQIYVLENRLWEHADCLPDVRSNNIMIKQLSSVAAIRRNAEMLGITFEMMTGVTSTSFLHNPSTAIDLSPGALAAQWEHVSPDMRPTPAQIRHAHHPWIDTLPSPTLRQRLIECTATDPPMIQLDEFCTDLQKDGLICWGSTIASVHVGSGSGAPWDVRSWEAQPWFLRKWWFVLGGNEGELFRSSRWWHAMRGDRLKQVW